MDLMAMNHQAWIDKQNKSAAARARTSSNRLSKQLKEYRKISVEETKANKDD
jgi:hypothetical protein